MLRGLGRRLGFIARTDEGLIEVIRRRRRPPRRVVEWALCLSLAWLIVWLVGLLTVGLSALSFLDEPPGPLSRLGPEAKKPYAKGAEFGLFLAICGIFVISHWWNLTFRQEEALIVRLRDALLTQGRLPRDALEPAPPARHSRVWRLVARVAAILSLHQHDRADERLVSRLRAELRHRKWYTFSMVVMCAGWGLLLLYRLLAVRGSLGDGSVGKLLGACAGAAVGFLAMAAGCAFLWALMWSLLALRLERLDRLALRYHEILTADGDPPRACSAGDA